MLFRWRFCFSKIKQNIFIDAVEQAHEQNNAVIKGMGGAISGLNKGDESGLARRELCFMSCL